jgi:SAM-dependent methyltransferase
MNREREPSRYIHGVQADEQGRLAALNDLINEASLRELAPRPGESLLDVGSGLGQFTRAVARATGARAVGVENNPRQRAEAARRAREAGEDGLAEFRAGEADAMPLRVDERGTFDVAHARFLLEHVRDPLAVVRAMVAAVRPGGRIVLADDDHDVLRLWPEPPGFREVWQAYIRTYDRLGNDPYVGRRLVSLLQEAGATPARNTWVFFGSCSGNATFPLLVGNLAGILEGAKESILSEALLDPVYFAQGVEAVRAWGRRPDAAFWYAVSWAEGVRPAG